MIGRRMKRSSGYTAYGLNVRRYLGRRQQAAVTGFGTLPYFYEYSGRIGFHSWHGPDDAVPAEVPRGYLQDHVFQLR